MTAYDPVTPQEIAEEITILREGILEEIRRQIPHADVIIELTGDEMPVAHLRPDLHLLFVDVAELVQQLHASKEQLLALNSLIEARGFRRVDAGDGLMTAGEFFSLMAKGD